MLCFASFALVSQSSFVSIYRNKRLTCHFMLYCASFALVSQSSFVSINRNNRPIKVIFFTIALYIYELISLTIGLWILLNKIIINCYESCSCHCSYCVIHNNNNNNNNIYMFWCNTQQQQQQQQHDKIIKKLTEICYRKKCMTDLSTCSTPNETTHKVTTNI